MKHFKFTSMARNVCRILDSLDAVKKGAINLKNMELGDTFRDASFTAEEYELLGSTNKFFSSEYLGRVGRFIKESQSKL